MTMWKSIAKGLVAVAAAATLAACGSTGGGRSGGGSTVTLIGCRSGYTLSSPAGDSYRCTARSLSARQPRYRLLCEPGYRIADLSGAERIVRDRKTIEVFKAYTCTKRVQPPRGDN